MKYVGIYHQRRSNNIKTAVLLIAYPILQFLIIAVILLLLYEFDVIYSLDSISQVFPIVLCVTAIWYLTAYLFHRRMISKRLKAHSITRIENPRLYNIVENMTIANGMDMPRLDMSDSSELNACAYGINKKTYTVCVTSGLCSVLDDDELSGVIGHELTHIKCNDTRLNVVSTVFINIFGFLATACAFCGITLLSIKSDRDDAITPILSFFCALFVFAVAIVCYIGKFVSRIIQASISRKREFIADTGGAEMSGNPLALASALRKISQNPAFTDKKSNDYAMAFVHSSVSNIIFATHPSIEKRIKILEQF